MLKFLPSKMVDLSVFFTEKGKPILFSAMVTWVEVATTHSGRCTENQTKQDRRAYQDSVRQKNLQSNDSSDCRKRAAFTVKSAFQIAIIHFLLKLEPIIVSVCWSPFLLLAKVPHSSVYLPGWTSSSTSGHSHSMK